MYVLTTKNGGCIVDAVSQISSGDNPLIAVSVMKSNYTNELLKQHDKFALSVLGKEVNPEIEVLSQYANSFTDAAKGKAIAQQMIQQNADIIFKIKTLR